MAIHTLDGGELGCARLLILLRERIVGLPAGDVVQLSTVDPVAPIDLPVWCRMTGHDYLGPVGEPVPRAAAADGTPRHPVVTYAVRISAQPRATKDAAPWHLSDPEPATSRVVDG